jgi:hypothetical protein
MTEERTHKLDQINITIYYNVTINKIIVCYKPTRKAILTYRDIALHRMLNQHKKKKNDMSLAFLGQNTLRHTAGRVEKIFLIISINTVKYSRENNTHKRKKTKNNRLPHPSHNVYRKIVKPWLSEGSLPRALPCVSETKYLSRMAETEFRDQGKMSTQNNGHPGKRAILDTTVREWRKGRKGERKGGQETEDIIKNITRKLGHGYCETAE